MLNPDLMLVLSGSSDNSALKTVQAIHRSSKAFLACIGPADDGKRIISLLNEGGADQYLDEAKLESELNDTLKSVRAKNTTGSPMGRVIVFLEPCGGCGASTLAVNVATVLAKKVSVHGFDFVLGEFQE